MNELKVGLLAIATMLAIGYMSFKVTSNQSGFGEYVRYRTIVRDASGIFPKTPIKVAGINAGRIKEIELQGNQALITFEVLDKVLITKGSKLKVRTVGFLGDKYLEINIAEGEERLDENSFLEPEYTGGVENLVKDVSEILKDVKVVVKSVKDSLAPKGEEPPLTVIINDVKELVANTKKVTESLKNVISDKEDRLHRLADNLEKFSQQLVEATNAKQDGTTLHKLNEVMDNAKKATADLKDIIADIKSGKGTVGELLVNEDIADEVKQTLASVKKVVGRVDQIRTELSLFTGADTEHGGKTEAALKIFPSPERFYLLGMATSEIGPEVETETNTVINGVETNEVKKEKKKDTYRFNVQLGRKVHNWTFRGGLIESSGGLAVDYEFNKIGTIFSLEAFDYRENIGLNLRFSTEVHLWNVLYGKLAAEDMITSGKSFSLSAGLRFSDEDLKGLLSFFL